MCIRFISHFAPPTPTPAASWHCAHGYQPLRPLPPAASRTALPLSLQIGLLWAPQIRGELVAFRTGVFHVINVFQARPRHNMSLLHVAEEYFGVWIFFNEQTGSHILCMIFGLVSLWAVRDHAAGDACVQVSVWRVFFFSWVWTLLWSYWVTAQLCQFLRRC